MKKNLFALVALVAFVMFGMVSCGGGKSESYDVTFYNASYDGYKDWGAHHYVLNFRIGNVEWDGTTNYANDGTIVHIELLSPNGANDMPEVGNYPFIATTDGKTNQAIAGKLDVTYFGSYVTTVTNKVLDVELCVDGMVVVSGTKEAAHIEVQITKLDGTEVTYTYNGPLNITDETGTVTPPVDGDFQYEPDQVSTFNITCNEVIQFYNLGKSSEAGAYQYQLVLYDGVSNRVWLNFYANPDGTIPTGDYPLSATLKEGVAEASHGFENGFDTGCFVNTDFEKATSYFSVSYYLTTGLLSIKDNSVTLNAKSKKGSTFNVTYSGELTVVDMGGK
ncbi:MAG: hypothetical protein ACI3ZZ_04570 [Candidatus Aphodosoma sp.]